jgi:hypothetical protein
METIMIAVIFVLGVPILLWGLGVIIVDLYEERQRKK